MCEVTRNNFERVLPCIEEDIEHATFIAIDTEFTGLIFNKSAKPSLFDDGAARYTKLRSSVSQFTLSQIGLAIFMRHPEKNLYVVHTYNIYLLPCGSSPIDEKFSVQSSSFDFLCRHQFDFNKLYYGGVSFLNKLQEKRLREHLDLQVDFEGLERDIDEQALAHVCTLVSDWLVGGRENVPLVLSEQDMEALSSYVVIKELRLRFPQIWASHLEDGQVMVEVVDSSQREALRAETRLKEEARIVNEKLGFSRVFQALVSSKKPIIGHNNFMDLMYMYDKFHQPLPAQYSKFKMDIHELFPQIYDTKFIVGEVRRMPFRDELIGGTSLGELYHTLESDKVKFYSLYSPDINHGVDFGRYVGQHIPHEAGYDAYMCGCVFIRMAHLCAMKDIVSTNSQPMSANEHFAAVSSYINNVNLIRATIQHVKLDGTDPQSRRPEWLYVKSRYNQPALISGQLGRMFSAYGSVDIQMTSQRQALVAVANFRSARDILKNFKKNEKIHVSRYSIWRHSPVFRHVLWAGVFISGSVCLWTVITTLKKK